MAGHIVLAVLIMMDKLMLGDGDVINADTAKKLLVEVQKISQPIESYIGFVEEQARKIASGIEQRVSSAHNEPLSHIHSSDIKR